MHTTTALLQGRQRFDAQRGFGLIEVLVGCLLMATLSLGACAALHQALLGIRAAALQGHAAGLAMDLAEELAVIGAPDSAPIAAAWIRRVRETLPAADGEVATTPAAARITLQWRGGPESIARLSLPLPAGFGMDGPQ